MMLLLLLSMPLLMFSTIAVATDGSVGEEDSVADATSNEIQESGGGSDTTADEVHEDGLAEIPAASGEEQDEVLGTTDDETFGEVEDSVTDVPNDEENVGAANHSGSEDALADETGGEEQAIVSDQTSLTSAASDEEEDPVHIYFDGSKISSPPGPEIHVCFGEPSYTIPVIVKWDGKPDPDKVSWADVQMVDYSGYGITFVPSSLTLYNPSSDSQGVTVIIPAFPSTGTYPVNIYADVTGQGPNNTPRVAGTNGYFQIVVESCARRADLSIEKSGPLYAHAGDTITYTYTVANAGPDSACSVSVLDDLAGTATYVSGDADEDGCLDTDETWIFTATYTVTAGDPDPLVNTATVSSDAEDPDTTNNVATWSVDILHPAISIDKTADKDYAYAGETITYTYTVTNIGDTPLCNVNVIDDVAGPATYVSGDADDDGCLDTDETWIFTATYTVTAGDPDPLENTATASGKDALDMEVTATDTWSVDLIAKICGYKFYDANANGMWDDGEPAVAGFKIELYMGDSLLATAFTGEDGSYCFDWLDAGTYVVKEVLPSGNWINTTPLSKTIDLLSGEVSEGNNFGNLCLTEGYGGRTLGFWANAGNSLINGDDISYLNSLNLFKPNGWSYPPFTSNSQIRDYLLRAKASDMWLMLSAQLIAAILNVRHGFLDGSTMVCIDPPPVAAS